MIEFTSTQLSWILIGACSIGGTGYMSMNEKIENLDKKILVTNNTLEHNNQQIDKLISKVDEMNKILSERK